MPGRGKRDKEEGKKRLRRPMPLSRVFVIDVSGPSAQRGVVGEVCEALRRGLYGKRKEEGTSDDENGEEEEETIGKGEKIAIVTVAETVGFWNLSVSARTLVVVEICVLMTAQPMSSAPSLMAVSDLDDMYIPLASGFLVDPLESRSQVEALLDILPRISAERPDGNRVAAGSAVKGALAGLVSLPSSHGPLSPSSN
jgi:protein transport protein SEC24